MKEIINTVDSWLAGNASAIALATVIETWGSAPRKVGAKMAFTAGGAAISGSVSGGCVEGAVIAAGDEVLATGRSQLLHFGVADETAWNVGLACGGTIEVFVEVLDAATYTTAREWIMRGEPGALVTIIHGPEEALGRKLAAGRDGSVTGSLGLELDKLALPISRQATGSMRAHLTGEVEVFIDKLRPAPVLVMVGGAHIAVALAQMAKIVGYRTELIDPRRAFGSEERFPQVDAIIQTWPDKAFAANPPGPDTAVVTLSHDPKIDDPGLIAALNSDAFYIGALGSSKTNARRRERLAAAGFSSAQLARIHAPVGLNIGADNPEEIALAIMSEIVAVYRGKDDA